MILTEKKDLISNERDILGCKLLWKGIKENGKNKYAKLPYQIGTKLLIALIAMLET